MKNLYLTRIALSMGLVVALLCAASCGGSMSPAGDFAVNFPSFATVTAGGGALTVETTIQALNGFNGNISLAITGVPEGVTITLSPKVAAPGAYTMTLSASSEAAPGTYTVTLLFTSDHLQHTSTLELQVT